MTCRSDNSNGCGCNCKCATSSKNTEKTPHTEEFFKEKADRLGVPLIPKLPIIPNEPATPNPIVAVCGECGLSLHQVMAYVCTNQRCPTWLCGPTCNSVKVEGNGIF